MRHGTEQVRESIQDRKIPLLDIRRQALEDHYQFMRLSHKDSIVAAGRARLEELIGREGSDMSNSELCQHVEKLLALHHFAVWHDHSTVCGCGYILMTLKEAYNSTVHYTPMLSALTGESVDVQAAVERPHLHILAAGSSSAEDLVAFTADRVDCLKEWKTTLQTKDGTQVTDVLRYFNGDKITQWMEGGCQLGGKYKCGSCGVEVDSFADSACCNQVHYRSLHDIQTHVLAGVHGGKRLMCEPVCTTIPARGSFAQLSLEEVRQELAARHFDSEGKSKEVRQHLIQHL